MLTQCTSLRSPSEPSALTRNFGTTNRLMPFTPSGAPADARQHQVDDVLGHVVLAVGDEDLRAEDPVAAVGLRLGAGAHQRQVGAGLRLGQVHRAGPLAGRPSSAGRAPCCSGDAGGEQRLDRAVGQQRAQREAHVGAVEHLDAGGADRLGQALAAEVGRMLQPLPAALGELPEGLLEAGRRGDLRRPATSTGSGRPRVQRREHALR